jgi:DNA invertase Pin-like site-specific DNA recombinase
VSSQGGEENGRSVLKASDVLQMRRIYSEGATSYRALAEAYSVSVDTAYRAVNHLSWSDLDEE